MVYNIFYWLHIASNIIWLAACIATLFFAYKTGEAYQTPDEIRYMQLERKSTSIGAHVGAVGILISGTAMSVIPGGPQWGWFNIPLYNWLAIKQLLFIVILVLVGFSIRGSIAFKKTLEKDKDSFVNAEARKKWKSVYTISLFIYLLVIVNTYLGLAKPI